MQRALELFGVPPARWLPFDDTDWELPTCWFAGKPYGYFLPSPVEVRQVVTRLLGRLHLPDRTGPNLYISRARCAGRRLANEDQVRESLERRGFETYFPELHTVDEQIAAFRAARVIAGSFGSGLTNIMFCRPGTGVVVLYDETYFDTCIWVLGCGVGLNMLGIGHQPDHPINLDRLGEYVALAARQA